MSNPNDPNVSEPTGIPPVPPVPHYGSTPPTPPAPPAPPAAPQYVAPQAPAPQYAAPQQPAPQYASPQAQAPQYAAAQPYPSGPVRPTNGMAIAALITGILVPIVGIFLGHISLKQIKRTGEAGHGMALAGLICGYVFTAFWVLYFVFIIFVVVLAGASSSYNY